MVPKHTTSGFGLIELMVSISIMLLLMTIIITRQDSFNGATLLRGEAYEIALLTREVQALAVSAASLGGANDYRGVLGVHFSLAPSLNQTYKVFRDGDGDYFYDAGEEYGKGGQLDPRFIISEIRLIQGSAPPSRPPNISLVFERPNFDAKIFLSPNSPAPTVVSGVEIDVRVRGNAGSGPGAVRTVEITRTGQISVKNI